MQFHPPPLRILTDAETLSLADPETGRKFLETNPALDKYRVKSPMLCAFMDELEKTGYVYNLWALREFEKAHGLDQQPENGSALSILVYNNQRYREHDRLVREGWTPGSQEMLEEAHRTGRGIKVNGENILGGQVEEVFQVREIGGKLYAVRPKKRKYAVAVIGMPCKLADLPKKGKAPKRAEPDCLTLA